jgi:hypothetical protein
MLPAGSEDGSRQKRRKRAQRRARFFAAMTRPIRYRRLLSRPLFSSPEMDSSELLDDPRIPSLLLERPDDPLRPDESLWLELLPERFDDDDEGDAFWLDPELPAAL